MKLIRNISTAIRHPGMAFDYTRYLLSRFLNGGRAVSRFSSGILLTDFSDYSEYRSVRDMLSRDEILLLQRLSRLEGAVFDIGANLGIFCLHAAQSIPAARIFAFEPNPSTYQSLKANLSLNEVERIEALNLAVSNADGTASFQIDHKSRATASLTQGHSSECIEVQTVTLNSFALQHNIDRIPLLKVDVEGFEDSVFEGASQLIKAGKIDLIYYEVCPGMCQRNAKDPWAATQLLADHGYSIHGIAPDGQLYDVSFPDSAVTCTNWLAVKQGCNLLS